ncbi:hypothetical protein EJB05_22459, partial [Eragrostis curvula]
PRTETRVPVDQQTYLPCDERVGDRVVRAPCLPNIDGHFKSFAEIYSLFGLNELGQLTQAKGKFPVPQVISVNPSNWQTDEEFARQMLSGSNPVCIKRVMEFPLTSELDRRVYGDQDSKITRDHIEKNMGYMTVEQNMGATTVEKAMSNGRLYVADHHDWMMPYLKRINELPGEEERGRLNYAARTLLFLKDDLTLTPLAIELSSPHSEDEQLGAVSTVYTPPHIRDDNAGEGLTSWDLAKAHATVNDASKNNFVYHWLNIHVTLEPLVIAMNRQLSVLHPIHKLLKPHFRKMLHINATTRQIIVSSGDRRDNGDIFRGIQEVTYLPSKYALEMSSQAYRTWNFNDLALPRDLINRGMAKGDPRSPEKLELLMKDYPFAVDGLELWIAIKKWVADYCTIYYSNDHDVANDCELQEWWREVRHEGHVDMSEAPWWPSLDCLADLEEICAIVIWLASAYHAAIGLRQFTYLGFVPNRPTLTCRPMPEAGTEVTESDFLASITPRKEALSHMAMAVQSMMLKGEVNLGERQDIEGWTSDERAAMALARFQSRLQAVTGNIERRNGDPTLRNRAGPVEVPYTRLTPTTMPGPVIGGIPNSPKMVQMIQAEQKQLLVTSGCSLYDYEDQRQKIVDGSVSVSCTTVILSLNLRNVLIVHTLIILYPLRLTPMGQLEKLPLKNLFDHQRETRISVASGTSISWNIFLNTSMDSSFVSASDCCSMRRDSSSVTDAQADRNYDIVSLIDASILCLHHDTVKRSYLVHNEPGIHNGTTSIMHQILPSNVMNHCFVSSLVRNKADMLTKVLECRQRMGVLEARYTRRLCKLVVVQLTPILVRGTKDIGPKDWVYIHGIYTVIISHPLHPVSPNLYIRPSKLSLAYPPPNAACCLKDQNVFYTGVR